MNLLAIDSASSILSVAAANGDTICCAETEAGMKHSELVMDCIDSQMKKAKLEPKDLDGVLCMGGPGSFTGLRIGYSIAKALALPLSIPFAPVPTLDCIAWQKTNGLVLAVIEARKGAYFFSLFQDGKRLTPDKDASADQIAAEVNDYKENIILTGPGSDLLYDSLSGEIKKNIALNHEKKGYAKEIISIVQTKKILDNDNSAHLYAGPEYIRLTDAERNNL